MVRACRARDGTAEFRILTLVVVVPDAQNIHSRYRLFWYTETPITNTQILPLQDFLVLYARKHNNLAGHLRQ